MTTEEVCQLHKWKIREKNVKVYDAVIFSIELDLLEIRLRELYDVVDKFIILESDLTFTGYEKPLVLTNYLNSIREEDNLFSFAKDKMVVGTLTGWKMKSGEGPFYYENKMRSHMDNLIRTEGIKDGDILIMSDVDEIPRSTVLEVYKKCQGMPDIVHLQMTYFTYSFGFRFPDPSWRPAIHIFNQLSTHYSHGRRSNLLLADAGWHCTFCFPNLADFQFKMTAYSHAERAHRHPKLLQKSHIQAQICQGKDVYDMLPEANTFGDLLKMMEGAERLYTARDLPQWVVKQSTRFDWLLPGGDCHRRA